MTSLQSTSRYHEEFPLNDLAVVYGRKHASVIWHCFTPHTTNEYADAAGMSYFTAREHIKRTMELKVLTRQQALVGKDWEYSTKVAAIREVMNPMGTFYKDPLGYAKFTGDSKTGTFRFGDDTYNTHEVVRFLTNRFGIQMQLPNMVGTTIAALMNQTDERFAFEMDEQAAKLCLINVIEDLQQFVSFFSAVIKNDDLWDPDKRRLFLRNDGYKFNTDTLKAAARFISWWNVLANKNGFKYDHRELVLEADNINNPDAMEHAERLFNQWILELVDPE